MRLGCIGIGSNAIRLLVAGWKNGKLIDTRRERRGTRLFAGLVGGKLTEESMQSSVEAVGELAGCARADGAQKILFLPPARCATRQTAGYSPTMRGDLRREGGDCLRRRGSRAFLYRRERGRRVRHD